MKNYVNDFYRSQLSDYAFNLCETPEGYPSIGECWQLDPSLGEGYYWIYASSKHYNIKLHNFRFYEDYKMDMMIPECLSVTYYDSIAGEELGPYRHLKCHVVKSFLGGYQPYRALIHNSIPVHSIGIEYEPEFYETYLKERFDEEYNNPREAFRSVDETADFPEMEYLLRQLKKDHGNGIAAGLFYDAKVSEALSLIYEHHRRLNMKKPVVLPPADIEMLDTLADYIRDHFARELTIEMLANVGCMGTTKLKKCFKAYFGCTIAEYIQNVRLTQAEHFLAYTDLSIGQIAQAVGYSNAGRFAELFRKANGVLPMEYKKMILLHRPSGTLGL